MNCNCLQELSTKIMTGRTGTVRFKELDAFFESGKAHQRTYTTVTTKETGKDPDTFKMHHKFCPFCGKDAEPEVEITVQHLDKFSQKTKNYCF